MATPGSIQVQAGTGQIAAPGQLFDTQIRIRVFDTDGVPMPNEPMVWSLPLSGPSGLFRSTESTTPFNNSSTVDGYCTCDVLRAGSIEGTWLGAVQFVNALGISAGYSATNRAEQAVPKTVTITAGAAQKAALNAVYATRIQAQVKDQFGAAGPQAIVRFSVPAGFGTFAGGLTSVDIQSTTSGYATAPDFTANNVAGAFTVTISLPNSPTVTPVTTTFTNVDAAVPTVVQVYDGNNQQTPVSALFPKALKAKVTNGLGNPVAGVTVTFTSPSSGASCTFPTLFAVGTSLTDVGGIATSSTPLANAITGSYFVTATVPGASSAQYGLTNGLNYLPEVCTPLVASGGGQVQGPSNGTAWVNPDRINSTTNNGTENSVSEQYDTKNILSAFLPSAFADIADQAIITKVTASYQVSATRTGFYFPQMKIDLYDGTSFKDSGGSAGPSDGDGLFDSKTTTFLPPFSGGTVTGAQLKAGNFGALFSHSSSSGVEGLVRIRACKLSVCYQNPDIPSGAGGAITLDLCEA
jgi:hypothetical protein